MEKKKLKLSISGSSKKTLSSIEEAKSKSKNTVVIEKKNSKFAGKSQFSRQSNNNFKTSNNISSKPSNFSRPSTQPSSDFEKRKLAEQRATRRLKGEVSQKDNKSNRINGKKRELKFNDINIDQLLHMTVDDAIHFFKKYDQKRIIYKLQPLQDVGLGYVTLGQSSATLSGGEAQRIKLASFISQGTSKEKVLFIFDEPTTGLHFHDIQKLLTSFNALIERGHTIVVVEHNLELIKSADHIIDLGPEAGDDGGYLLGQGTPEEIIKVSKSHTGKYLAQKLK